MAADHPSPEMLWRAIDVYLREAYDGTPPRRDVQARLDALRTAPPGTLYDCRVVERDPAGPPGRFRVRLGNRFYPHMKLMAEPSPDGSTFLFKCDTHDRHCCPPATSPEYAAFLQLMQGNEAIAKRIESAWEAADVDTFKHYLRQDLERRRAAAVKASGQVTTEGH
jgi:hypothetical protein